MLKNSYISLAKKDYMEKPLFVFYTLLFCKLPLHGHWTVVVLVVVEGECAVLTHL